MENYNVCELTSVQRAKRVVPTCGQGGVLRQNREDFLIGKGLSEGS